MQSSDSPQAAAAAAAGAVAAVGAVVALHCDAQARLHGQHLQPLAPQAASTVEVLLPQKRATLCALLQQVVLQGAMSATACVHLPRWRCFRPSRLLLFLAARSRTALLHLSSLLGLRMLHLPGVVVSVVVCVRACVKERERERGRERKPACKR